MSVRLVVTGDAEREITEAARWYEMRREGFGVCFLAEVDTAISRIEAEPLSFPLVPRIDPGLNARRALLDRFPYFIAFVLTAPAIHIVAVGHQHRRPGYYLRRVRRLL